MGTGNQKIGSDRGSAIVRVSPEFACPVSPARHGALAELLISARKRFGVPAFWNAPVLSDLTEEANLVIARLRKYGGRPGWEAATEIEAALRDGAGGDGVDGSADQDPEPDLSKSVP